MCLLSGGVKHIIFQKDRLFLGHILSKVDYSRKEPFPNMSGLVCIHIMSGTVHDNLNVGGNIAGLY